MTLRLGLRFWPEYKIQRCRKPHRGIRGGFQKTLEAGGENRGFPRLLTLGAPKSGSRSVEKPLPTGPAGRGG